MADAKKDNNFIPTTLAADGSGISAGTEPLRVDPTTSRLLVDIEVTSSSTPATLSHKKDNNFVPVAYAITDDANETLTPLMIDTRSGYLFVDLLRET